MTKLYKDTTKALQELGYELLRNCNGSHTVWYNPKGGRELRISRNITNPNEVKTLLKLAKGE